MVTPVDVQQGGTGGGGARVWQQQGDDHGGGGGDLKVSELHEKHWSTLSLYLDDDGLWSTGAAWCWGWRCPYGCSGTPCSPGTDGETS